MPPGCFCLRRAARRRDTHSSSSGGREIRFRRAAPPGPAGGGEGGSELSASHLPSNSSQKSSIKPGDVTEPRAAVRAQKWSLKTPQTSGGQWGVGGPQGDLEEDPGGLNVWRSYLQERQEGIKSWEFIRGPELLRGPGTCQGLEIIRVFVCRSAFMWRSGLFFLRWLK